MDLFDTNYIQTTLKRALHYNDEDRFLYRWAEEQIQDRLKDIKRSFNNTLIISDFPVSLENASSHHNAPPYECIISILNIHRTNNPQQALHTMLHTLKPDGFFIGLFFGGETLQELKQSLIQTEIHHTGGAHQRTLPLMSKQEAGALMQSCGFALPVIESAQVHVGYKKLTSLYQDLRAMGETNSLTTRSRKNLSQRFFQDLDRYYKTHFFKDNTYNATFEILFCTGWAPHDSQQKPLRPGSGKIPLTEIL